MVRELIEIPEELCSESKQRKGEVAKEEWGVFFKVNITIAIRVQASKG